MTAKLQQFIASAGNNVTIVFPPGARYRVEGTLRLDHRANVTIEGTGAQTFATTRGDSQRVHWHIIGGTNIRFRGLWVRGANPNAGMSGDAYVPAIEAQHGFDIEGAKNVELDSVKVTDVYGDFVYIGREVFPVRDNRPAVWSDTVRIHDSTLTRNGRQGITVVAGRNIIIDHNDISHTHRATIDLEPNVDTGGAENVYIYANKIGIGRLNFLAVGATTASIKNVLVHKNVFDHHPISMMVAGRDGNRLSNFTITNNVTNMSADRTPMRFVDVDGVTVKYNIQPVNPNEPRGPVELIRVTGADISGNDWEHSCEIYVNICPAG